MVTKLQRGNQELYGRSIKPLSMSDNSLNPGINHIDNTRIHVIFDGSCLAQEKATLTHKKVINICIILTKR